MQDTLKPLLQRSPVIPVLVIPDPEQAVPLARALVDGGLSVLEITLRTPHALTAIRAIKEALPETAVGAGTVINRRQLDEARQAGADFIVSPGSTPDLLEAARKRAMPFLPGASTASEMMVLLEQGISTIKFFPAEAAGGVPMIKALGGPLPGISFCPTGGINLSNAAEYLALDNVACIGGSWMVAGDDLRAERWDSIRAAAAQAATLRTS